MKYLNTAPTNTGFFEVYAKLSKSIRLSGVFAQIVSAVTEVGGIFAAAYAALLPIFPAFAVFLAGAVALIGTAVIELGLRVLAPHTVDAVLYRRFAGLHLPMTIAVWVLTALLLTASGVLSFRNSKVIVSEFTPEIEQESTASVDSTLLAETSRLQAIFSSDSTTTAGHWESQIAATKTAYTGKTQAARQELANLIAREQRTGQSFATQKDRIRQKLADLEAEQAGKLADLEAGKAKELAAVLNTFRQAVTNKESHHLTAIDQLQKSNQEAEQERAAKVAQNGGGLGWFTVVCLVVFCASVILERIHRKGSGIAEKVELSQYDLNPSAWVEAAAAFRERWNYIIRSRIAAFAEQTPPPPLPVSSAQLYDPTDVANITANLILERIAEDEGIVYIEPKRRAVPFMGDANTNPVTNARIQINTNQTQNQCAVKAQGQPVNLADLTQRLKMYKKRLGSHEQKRIKFERSGKTTPQRTLDAIENNRRWVEHYENQIKALS
ncbi:MAG TPA: hypothetical protein PKA00_11140 [Saprospiraceae bacterium]|nr:hypothetical protein [Saprospiraceae bacterium]HMQ83457.1 hypothetical protein [Saprospiraceae bacterium]